jgi:hypothetical protein
MHEIRFNRQEIELLLAHDETSPICMRLLVDGCILGSADDVYQLREACTHALAFRGFNRQYEPTPEGQIYETLIDKPFVDAD